MFLKIHQHTSLINKPTALKVNEKKKACSQFIKMFWIKYTTYTHINLIHVDFSSVITKLAVPF